ncbi:MAG: UDP-N-acetylmuramoyl-L-alanyl-D-glutamate--2,6-diaminopimelate ligase [Candidatus Moraniibacteriota bacterium]
MQKIIPQKLKNFYHLAQAIGANVYYGFPAKKIKIIGVTGTNGKTTTCQMIAKILEESGKKVAMISTINFKLGKKEWINKTKFTTVSALATQKFIAEAVREKCDYLILETSSHSLDQYRVWGIPYDIAVITNITREHLDYHKTIAEYRRAKLKLFKNIKTAVINLDMEQPEEFLNCGAENIFGYTTQNKKENLKIKTLKAEKIKLGIDGSEFGIDTDNFKLNLLGLFNIENALAAICVGISEGIDFATIKSALEKITKIPGRMDAVENDLGIKIIIDYAVTPDSLEKLGVLILEQKKAEQKLIWVLGACGERDQGKRPLMGEIVAKYADYILVTNEDPYNEDPQKIIDAVFSGVLKNKKLVEEKNCWRVFDRKAAIKKALKLATPGDIILVTGKGAEETMAIGEKRIDWNDKHVIEEELDKLQMSS